MGMEHQSNNWQEKTEELGERERERERENSPVLIYPP
jgi:hypothetical protein